MQPRPFGNTGLAVTPFTLGTMRFLHGWDPPADHLPDNSLENAYQIIRTALEAGINLIETASAYGKSEGLIGRALARLPQYRGRYHLMTKAAPTPSGRELRLKVETSLKRLGVSRLELFALHGLNSPAHLEMTLAPGGCLVELERLRAEGVIGAIGFSTHAPPALVQQALTSGAFAFVNLHYYLFNQAHRETVALAHRLGMGVFIISPNDKGGMLYDPPTRLRELTAPLHPVNLNERWLLAQPEIHTLSIGLSEPEHLAIHLESLPPLPESDFVASLARLETAAADSPLGRCGSACHACLPCPVGIEMPDLFRLLHLDRTFGMTAFGRYRYAEMGPGDLWVPGANGNLCNDCGECLPRCPQRLPIPRLAREAHARLDSGQKQRRNLARRVRAVLPVWAWNGLGLARTHAQRLLRAGRRG